MHPIRMAERKVHSSAVPLIFEGSICRMCRITLETPIGYQVSRRHYSKHTLRPAGKLPTVFPAIDPPFIHAPHQAFPVQAFPHERKNCPQHRVERTTGDNRHFIVIVLPGPLPCHPAPAKSCQAQNKLRPVIGNLQTEALP